MHSKNSSYLNVEDIYLKAVQGIDSSKLESPNSLEWYYYVKNLADPFKVVYLVTVLENQIINGGFDQYFSNLYGQFSYLTIDALQKIHAFEKSKLLSNALSIYNPLNLKEEEFVKWLTKGDWLKEVKLDDLLRRTEFIDKDYWNSNEDVLALLDQYIISQKTS